MAVAWAALAVSIITFLYGESRVRNEAKARKAADERREREEHAAHLVGERLGELAFPPAGYTMRVRNVGKAVAEDVQLWLAQHLAGDELAGPATYFKTFRSMDPSDGWQEFTFEPPPVPGGGAPRPVAIAASWTDGNGPSGVREIGRTNIFL